MLSLQENVVTDLISAPQTVTASWADLGDVIDLRGIKSIGVWLGVDINSSANIRIKVLGLKTAIATAEFELGAASAFSSGVSSVDFGYYELTTDADQNVMIPIELNNMYPFAQIQVIAGTLGVTAAIILTAGVIQEK